MNTENLYTTNIASRSFFRFAKGLVPRLMQYWKFERARRKARSKGAKIADDAILIPELVAKANANLTVGHDSSIGSWKIDTRNPVRIGNHVIISNDSEIITTNHYIDSPEWEHKNYGIEIEDYVWIASNVLILPSCRKIGYGAVIGAGAVVVKDVPPMAVMGGNPAKMIKERKCVHDKLVISSLLSGDLKLYWKTWMVNTPPTQTYDVVYATDDNFVQHAAISILSLLDSNKDIFIHIHFFCMGVKENNIANVKDLLEEQNCTLSVYTIDNDTFADLPDPGIYSYASFLRLITSRILPNTSKVLYLDCDLVVNGSIKELFEIPMDNYAIAGCHDCTLSFNIIKGYIGYDYNKYGYLNSGVLLMNLDYWRTHNAEKKLLDFIKTHDLALKDQDAINYIFHKEKLILDPKWNCHVGFFSYPPLVVEQDRKRVRDMWNDAVIIHFTGPCKPWVMECVHPYKHIYLSCKKRTIWKYLPQKQLSSSKMKCYFMICMRTIKNIVARMAAYT